MLVGKNKKLCIMSTEGYHQYPFFRTEAFIFQLLGVLPLKTPPGYLPQESALNWRSSLASRT